MSDQTQPTLLVCGLVAADFIFSVDRMPEKADKYRARDLCLSVGGGAANAAIAMTRLGADAWLAGRLGDDAIATLVAQRLQTHGVTTRLMQTLDNARSSTSAILIDAAGERLIMNYRGDDPHEAATGWQDDPQAQWLAEQLDATTMAGVNAVLVDGRWVAGAAVVLAAARTRGIPAVLDAEQPVNGELAARATHVAFSRQGLEDFVSATADAATPSPTLSDALVQAAERLPGWVCVTDGEHGVQAVASAGAPIERFPAHAVAVRDTLGAGDVWHAAFALALARGDAESDAMRYANAAAAVKCTRFGGSEGAPTHAELDAFLAAQSR